ncbi:GH116 family glycosyl hydrolase [Amycolatopsis minnesotensis]|uniref:Beta-glucocerebrosidase 2-like protein n=1 Tax=Amycolatopsis minnesotensis TaxID=337894 RepID=A0ABN2QXK2_9PSEU
MSDSCCPDGSCEPGPSRRTFLTLGAAGLGLLTVRPGIAEALGLDETRLVTVPEDKNLTPDAVNALLSRGKPTEYAGAALRRIGMPVGGGCTGQVYLAGDGRLWAWDILNPSSYPLGGASGDGPHYANPLSTTAPFRQGFSIRTTAGGRDRTRTLDSDGFGDTRFAGSYPIGTTTYRAPDSPVEVACEAFSPFIPLSTNDSTLPATVLAFTVRNSSRDRVRVELTGSSENPVCLDTRQGQPVALHGERYTGRGVRGVEFSASEESSSSNDIVFEDWEKDTFEGWTVTGDAFGTGPVRSQDVPAEMRRFGDLNLSGNRFVTSFDLRTGKRDALQGSLRSKEFTVERRYVAASVGGGAHPGKTCLNVLVDGKVVASATGANSEPVVPATLDVSAHLGKRATIEIVDASSDGWGHVNVDAIVFTDAADIVFEDWEKGTYDGWTATGDAFGAGPVRPQDTPDYFRSPGELNVSGTYFVTSHNYRAGGGAPEADRHTGKLTSRPFTVDRRFVTMWVGGGSARDATCVNVVVDGKVVAAFTGSNRESLAARSADLRQWAGRTAHIEVVDTATGGWGHVNLGRILFSDRTIRRRPVASSPDFGTFSLAALEDTASVRASDVDGSVTVPFTLAPGQSRTVRFVFGWYFPTPDPVSFGWLKDGQRLKHHYASRFGSAREVVSYLARERDRLESGTRKWVRTWYEDSSMPRWFLERTLATASTLATNTCYRFDNGRFYAWEGIYCCVGTCGHVWNYAQSVARLFPDLERDTRERVDLGIALLPTGEIKNRGESGDGWFADGQCGTILRVYREHQMAPDGRFLRRNWPQVRKAVDWLVKQDGSAPNGILEGSQWNTLDAQWFGEIPWISGLYVAALRAAAAMADEMGDRASAKRYGGLADRGAKYLADELWDDEYGYFVQKVDPNHPTAVNSNRGCYIDQMYGQAYAAQLGLPRVFAADQAKTALRNVFRNNFLPDPAGYRPPGIPIGRVYATKGEPGTLMCTWPNGGSAETGRDGPVGYFNEVWTGQEYQFAAHLFAEGMTTEALAVTKAVDDRYHGEKRNPYNEIECSDHYARAMMSFGTYLAACGYEHHGPRGHLGFAPRITPEDFRGAFTTAEGWGLYSQRRRGDRQTSAIEVRHGRVRLSTLALEVPGTPRDLALSGAVDPALTASAKPVFETSQGVTGTRVVIRFPWPVTLPEGARLELTLSLG